MKINKGGVFLGICIVLSTSATLITLPRMLNKNNISPVINYRTRAELNELPQRVVRASIYVRCLESLGMKELDKVPYDLLQQLVYDAQSDKSEVYNINLYKMDIEENETPTWQSVNDKVPTLQYTNVTKDSQLSDNILEHLVFGYSSITLEGSEYVMEVLYDNVDLANWEATQTMLDIVKGATE